MTALFTRNTEKDAERSAPTIEELARAKFKDLTIAELKLLSAAALGILADCGEPNAPPGSVANDPAQAASWNGQREIRAAIIQWICVDSEAKAKVDARGIQVRLARISGELDLSFARVDFPLAFIRCGMAGKLNFLYATLFALKLTASTAKEVTLTGAQVKRGLFFDNGFTSDGGLKLMGAQIGGNLDCTGATLRGPEVRLPDGKISREPALVAEGARINGAAFLRRGFSAEGEVNFYGAQIGGDLECDQSIFQGQLEAQPDGAPRIGESFRAERVKTNGHVLLRHSKVTGEVNLCGAEIGGNLECDGGAFENPGGFAILAERMRITGNAFLRAGIRTVGMVSMPAADIGGNLQCNGGTFNNPHGHALHADGIKVRGSIALNQGFRSEGEVSLNYAEAGELDCRNGNFTNQGSYALVADSLKVTGSLLLSDKFTAAGQVRLIGAQIGAYLDTRGSNFANASLNLPLAKVASLLDSVESWPTAGNLYLDGFVYDRISESPLDSTSRLEWIRRQLPSAKGERPDRFRPEPYRQLAKVMRDQGKSDDALAVLIGLEDDRRKYGGMRLPARLWAFILKRTIAYGYRPLRALWFIAAFVLVGFAIFGAAYQAGAIVPTDHDAYESFVQSKPIPYYESFCAIVYSFDTFVPIIDLSQRSKWKPVDSSMEVLAKVPAAGASNLGGFLCQAAPLSDCWSPPIWLVRLFRLIDIVAGWFFTSLFVAGISGLVRND